MDDTAAPSNNGFLDGCYYSEDTSHGAATLVSFHFVRYILFTVMLTIAGPFVYRVVAAFFDLERDFKNVLDHFDDVTNGLIYSYIIFTLGNYAHTFNWVTLVFYFVGVFAYSALVEVPFLRVSLNSWRSWSKGAWAVMLTGLAVVILAAGFHIRWAYKADMLQWYLPLFVLATASVWLTIVAKHLHDYCIHNCPQGLGMERFLRRLALALFIWRGEIKQERSHSNDDVELHGVSERASPYVGGSSNSDDILYHDVEVAATNVSKPNGEPCDSQGQSEAMGAVMGKDVGEISPDTPEQPLHQRRRGRLTCERKNAIINERLEHMHYLNIRRGQSLPLYSCNLHLHHWQIFYILAFFTRFDRFASRTCAGLCLGIFTQGVAAYGYDSMLEHKH
ncbi:hypothetical protein COEREDRAFT_83617 [Coemansia reversa NRRL 1564]|uniref:Uncharacterized protein n=1 Tax=Coemansia reversa (strain ATCC 12441 / NRRL 1564) TaxID=763665 RepID=A0A2G5B2P3_COERN|nr:hypothetical protein COEREDRAFT_83617 [Coemansia reversa NRRL 1564]|eukprot:PIA13276.1 hypothetical protein COEREDRAFT_83617 [Coemansia reversa NRRL 1564]